MFDPLRARFAASFVASIPFLLLPSVARAACNEPPPLPADQPSVLYATAAGGGFINTPFLIPGVKTSAGHTDQRWIRIAAAAIADTDVVTAAYLPPQGGAAKAGLVVLAKTCNGVPTCGGLVKCLPTSLKFATQPNSVRFAPEDLKVGSVLRAGHVRLAVSSKSNVPCWLSAAAQSCATSGSGLHACIDELIPPSGAEPREKLTHLTALPAPNDFSRMCESVIPGRCNGTGKDLSFTLDAVGDILIPMFWGKVLRKQNDPGSACDEEGVKCIEEDVTAETTIPSGLGSNQPIVIPDSDPLYREYLQTFNEVGQGFSDDPGFFPLPDAQLLKLAGDIDKPYSVLRIRHTCDTASADCVAAARSFDLTGRVPADGSAIVIERTGRKKGKCEDASGAECTGHGNCAGGPCLRFDGDLEPQMAPAPPPPAPGPARKAFPLMFWALVALALGVAYLLIRRLYPGRRN